MGQVTHQHQRIACQFKFRLKQKWIIFGSQTLHLKHAIWWEKILTQYLCRLFGPELVRIKNFRDADALCRDGTAQFLCLPSSEIAQRTPRIFQL